MGVEKLLVLERLWFCYCPRLIKHNKTNNNSTSYIFENRKGLVSTAFSKSLVNRNKKASLKNLRARNGEGDSKCAILWIIVIPAPVCSALLTFKPPPPSLDGMIYGILFISQDQKMFESVRGFISS